MEAKHPDRRVLRTKRAIRNAFAQLLVQRDINDITITDIAELADINRKTFYNYYSSVYQVIDEVENEIIHAFESGLKDFDFQRNVQDPNPTFSQLSKVIEADIDFYGALFQAKNNSHLRDKLTNLLRDKTVAAMLKKFDGDPKVLQIAVDFTMSGITAVYMNWFNSGRTIPMEELSRIVSQLVAQGLESLLSPKTAN